MTSLTDRALLERLVGFDSTSRNSNRPIADFVCDYLDSPSVVIHQHPSDDGEKVTVIVRTKDHEAASTPGTPVPGLSLSGHLDVVPADEPEWTSDPFVLTEREGMLYGRGASDMKGFVALAINRFRSTVQDHPSAPLALLLTRDEELGTIGAHHWAKTWNGAPLPTDMLVGEPTELRVVTMHKGFVQLRITLTGIPAHSGYPHLGKSAIEPAGTVLIALTELRRSLDAERPDYSEHFPAVPYPALNIGRVHGGSAVNVVPDHCAIDVGIRLLPTMTGDQMCDRVRAAVADALGDTPFALDLISDSPPMWLDAETDLSSALRAEVQQQETETVSYATDAGWFQTVGYRCVIFGPGSIAVAHKPNERMPIDQFERGGAILDRVISQRYAMTS